METLQEIQENIINTLFIEKKYIFEFYSTDELRRIFTYANNDISKINYLLENYTKEDLMKKMYEDTRKEEELQQKKIREENERKLKKPKKKKISKVAEHLPHNLSPNPSSSFEFIKNANLIDIKDALNTINKVKIIEKIKREKQNSKNSQIQNQAMFIRELNKKIEEKEKKFFSLYIANPEDNDIFYLQQFFKEVEPSQNPLLKYQAHPTETTLKLFGLLLKMPLSLQSFILSFVDIFTLGKLMQCSRYLHKIIKYNVIEKVSMIYTSSIFFHSNLYEMIAGSLRKKFSSHFEMIKSKNRIHFGGIYYSKVKYIKETYVYGKEGHKNVVVEYYRMMRFFPNGDVVILTSPFFKSKKIRAGIRNGTVDFKKGNFVVNNDEKVIISCEGDEYVFNFGWNDIRRYRAGFSKNDIGVIRGIELISYSNVNKNTGEKFDIEITDKFPRLFKFRNLDVLKKGIYLKSEYIFVED